MFRTFNYINEVYKTKSFSKAAQNLFISQPSLSLTIKKFESDAGITIFDRSVNPIQLTDSGMVYMEGIQRILAIESDLQNYVEDYNSLKVGKMTIGAPHFFSSFLLPTLIAEFHNRYPYIEIKMVEADTITLQNMTMSGEIDMMIESNQLDENLHSVYNLFIEHVLIAVPSTYPINDSIKDYSMTRDDIIHNRHMEDVRQPIPIEVFKDYSFLLMEKGHDMHNRSAQIFKNSDFEPQVFMYLNQLMTSYNMTRQQMGISFVSDTIVKLMDYSNDIVYYKVNNEIAIRHITLSYKRNRYLSKSMGKFIDMILNTSFEKLNKAQVHY